MMAVEFLSFLLQHKKVFHKDWRIRGGTIGGDLYLRSLFVCPSRVEVSFSSTLEVPSKAEIGHEKALLEKRSSTDEDLWSRGPLY
jgi:hypothetical protein